MPANFQGQPGKKFSVSVEPNRTVTDLVEESNSTTTSKSVYEFVSDPLRMTSLERYGLHRASRIKYGVVVYSMPYCGWYKVQLEGIGGVIGCAAVSHSSRLPLGVRNGSVIPPGSQVLVYELPGAGHGLIFGIIPDQVINGNAARPSWLSQDGCSGFSAEDCYTWPFTGLFREGGVKDFSNNNPIDSTTLEWSQISSTGIGLLIDDFQTFLRVNEACGLFLNYFDSHTRLAGIAMDIVSAAHELSARDDEGELQLELGYATYPWEALGAFDKESLSNLIQDFGGSSTARSQLTRGRYDIAVGMEDVQPFYRYREFGGYLGQGHKRALVVPGRKEGIRQYGQTDVIDPGVFDESIALDGSYMLRAAKMILLQKTSMIPQPTRKRLAEDTQEGNDDRENNSDTKENYKASGLTGGGADAKEHKVGDIDASQVPLADRNMLKASGLQDTIAHATNWKAAHPFHYHEGDFDMPEESAMTMIGAGQEKLNFGELATKPHLPHPEAIELDIDHRYEKVEYFRRESAIVMTDDGGVVIRDGYGSEIRMTGGHIQISCPGDIQLLPGRMLLGAGSDIVMKAHDSVDISASNKDVRIKADRNMQLLAGNSGVGGILLESKADGDIDGYQRQVGEDVASSGIVLKAANSELTTYSSSVYMRTGRAGFPLGSGDIIFDASKGERDVVIKGQLFRTYTSGGVEHSIGPGVSNSQVNATVFFSSGFSQIPGYTVIDGPLSVHGQTLIDGGIQATGTFASAVEGALYVQKAGKDLSSSFNDTRTGVDSLKQSGQSSHQQFFENFYYANNGRGSNRQIEAIAFGFRDDEEQMQYNTASLKFVGPRWQQMVSLGQGSGGSEWQENPVSYQGKDGYPWPGRKAWVGEEGQPGNYVQVADLNMYDSEGGRARDRGEVYEDATYSALEETAFKGYYRTIRN